MEGKFSLVLCMLCLAGINAQGSPGSGAGGAPSGGGGAPSGGGGPPPPAGGGPQPTAADAQTRTPPADEDGACNQQAIALCFSPIEETAKGTTLDISKGAFALDEPQVTSLCSDLEDVKTCLDDKLDDCEENLLAESVQANLDALQELCDNKQAYLEARQCVVQETLISDTLKCKESLTKEDRTDQLTCDDWKDALKCVYDTVDDKCGEPAASLQFTFYALQNKKELTRLGCEPEQEGNGAAASISSTWALLVLPAVLARWL